MADNWGEALNAFVRGGVSGYGAGFDLQERRSERDQRRLAEQTQEALAGIDPPIFHNGEDGNYGFDGPDMRRHMAQRYEAIAGTAGSMAATQDFLEYNTGMWNIANQHIQQGMALLGSGDMNGAARSLTSFYGMVGDGNNGVVMPGEGGLVYADADGNQRPLSMEYLAGIQGWAQDPMGMMRLNLQEQQFEHQVMVDTERLALSRASAARAGQPSQPDRASFSDMNSIYDFVGDQFDRMGESGVEVPQAQRDDVMTLITQNVDENRASDVPGLFRAGVGISSGNEFELLGDDGTTLLVDDPNTGIPILTRITPQSRDWLSSVYGRPAEAAAPATQVTNTPVIPVNPQGATGPDPLPPAALAVPVPRMGSDRTQ